MFYLKRAGLVLLLVSCVLLSLTGLTAALAQATPLVHVEPALAQVAPGQSVVISVTAQDALDLGAFQFDLLFDPALLRADDVALGAFLGSTGRTVSELGPVVDNTAGQVRYGAFTFGSSPGPSGTGTLAVLSFTTFLTPGTSLLDVQNLQLIDTQAHKPAAQVAGGSVAILSDQPLVVTRAITAGPGLYSFDGTCVRVNLSDPGELSTLTVTLVYSFPTAQLDHRPLPRTYLITGDSGGWTAELAACYIEADLAVAGVVTESALTLYRYSGSGGIWVPYPSVVDTTTNWVTATYVSALSTWAIGAPPGNVPTATSLRRLHVGGDARRWLGALIAVGVLCAGAAGAWQVHRRRR